MTIFFTKDQIAMLRRMLEEEIEVLEQRAAASSIGRRQPIVDAAKMVRDLLKQLPEA